MFKTVLRKLGLGRLANSQQASFVPSCIEYKLARLASFVFVSAMIKTRLAKDRWCRIKFCCWECAFYSSFNWGQ